MANTLTGLIRPAYEALNVVSRELVGFIPSVMRNSSLDRAALNQEIRSPYAPAANVANIAPAMSVPEPTDQTVGHRTLRITKSRAANFGFTGDETQQVNTGLGVISLQGYMILEGIRALVNEIENDIWREAYGSSGRFTGTIGTTPFAAAYTATANVRRLMDEAGAPMSGRTLVIDGSAGVALRSQANYNQADKAGDNTMLRQGVMLDLHGFAIRESAQIAGISAGAGTGYLANRAAAQSGTSVIVDTGSGTLNRGAYVTFASTTGGAILGADLTGPGTAVFNSPGFANTIANNSALTAAGYIPNVAFSADALALAIRPPAVPEGGDMATDRVMIQDPRSGLVFEMAHYKGYHKNRYEIGCSWGVAAMNPQHIVTLRA